MIHSDLRTALPSKNLIRLMMYLFYKNEVHYDSIPNLHTKWLLGTKNTSGFSKTEVTKLSIVLKSVSK